MSDWIQITQANHDKLIAELAIKEQKINELQQQLAAEREKAQVLVDALKLCRCNESARRDWDLMDAIDAALAKIGGK